MIKAMSLFSGGGIGETYLEDINIHTAVANEFVKERAELYKYRYPNTDMVIGDIQEKKDELIKKGKEEGVTLLLATPPCQGMSNLGKKDYEGDDRNYLIFDVFDIIDALDFDYIFIENVPKFLQMYYPANKEDIMQVITQETIKKNRKMVTETVIKSKVRENAEILVLTDLLQKKYGDKYEIRYGVYNAADYNVPQRRKRAIIRLYKKGLIWDEPIKNENYITLREAIGDLPSLEAGESCLERYPEYVGTEDAHKNGLKYHVAPTMNEKHIEMMKHTPSGCSAYNNTGDELEDGKSRWIPRRKDGVPISGFKDTYTRLKWDAICPTRTMKSGNISGSNNGHPGRPDENHPGLYTDARTMSLLELMIVTSLPRDIDLPNDVKDSLVRDVIGEGVPPKMTEAFLSMIQQEN